VVASTTCTLTDAGITASGNLFTNYGGSALVGRGVPSILGVANVTGSSATIGTTNLVASTPAAGHYRIQFYVDQGTACSNATAGSVLTTISWTDATAARVNTNNMLFTTSGSTTGPAGTAWVASTINVWAASASAITYATTYTACTTGTATYDLHAAVERLQ
jgi:hypothetical protein